MQIKHTFLFTFILGLVWVGCLFGYVLGPDPAQNGIFETGTNPRACAVAGCHDQFPVNSSGGSVTLSGLPANGWVPGQTYSLTVTVARTGQRTFGFQLSAVVDSTNQQAGTLAAGNSRVQIICGVGDAPRSCSTAGAIQYAEHSNASVAPSGTFNVNWTAPSSASVGTIRFNLAGNAANGDISNRGDFIYTRVDRLAPTASTPPPPTGSSTRAFSINDRGGISTITDGSGDLSVGYSRIQPDSGRTTPSGVAIFGFRINNVLVTEAGVPASPLMTSGRIYAEVAGAVNTGLAIANPNNQSATITFNFTNAAGTDFGTSVTTIEANKQIAAFLNQAPFNGGSSVQGTFSFSSNVPVSVIALRGLTNERGEFLITTLPITDTSVAPGSDIVYLSHFADGGGWSTQVILVNPTDSTISGTIQFLTQGTSLLTGLPHQLNANGQAGSSFSYSIPRRSSFKLATSGSPSVTTAGSVRVSPAGSIAPSGLLVFSYKPAGVTVSEAGVPGIRGNSFRMYAEVTGTTGAVGTIQTGLAMANSTPGNTNATLEVYRLDGTFTGLSTTMVIPGNGQVAKFVHEIFPTLTLPFQGVVRITSGGATGISVVGLRGRYNERGDFLITTTPPTNEVNAPSSAELLFPHLVNGGGYTTQFVLFSGSAGQTSAGNLRFFKQDGTSFSLTLN